MPFQNNKNHFAGLILLLALCSCDSTVTTPKTNSPVDTAAIALNSSFQRKNIHWDVIKYQSLPNNTSCEQPDSNITNLCGYDTIRNTNITDSSDLSSIARAHYIYPGACTYIAKGKMMCKSSAVLEFPDTALKLNQYSRVVVSFYTDSAIKNLKIALLDSLGWDAFSQNDYSKAVDPGNFSQSFADTIIPIKEINSVKGLNQVAFQFLHAPANTPGCLLEFYTIDSSKVNNVISPLSVPVHHVKVDLIPFHGL